MQSHKTRITKDVNNKQLRITREFDAPVEQVWRAWTTKDQLESWWAPKPWKAKIKSIDFREGGSWLYAMVGPKGEESWARSEFKTVEPLKRFVATDYFCDVNGNKNNDLPTMEWDCKFNDLNNACSMDIQITFADEAELKKMIEMGFEEGFTSALENLDELLDK